MENESRFLDRRTGYAESERSGERLLQAARRVSAANQFTGGLWEWPGYEYGLRRHGGSASSPDPFFSHGRCGIAFRHNSRRIHHGAFEEGLDKINRIFRIIGIGGKALELA